LIDSNGAHASAWSRALAAFGYRVPAGRLGREIGKGGQELLRDFVTAADHHFRGRAMGETQTAFFLGGFQRIRPFPLVSRTVRQMRRARLTVVLASSADRRVVEHALTRLRLGEAVRGFTCADDVHKAKPFDDIFSLAISRFRLGRRHPIAVGDTPYDVAAAHQIGLPCAALLSGGFSRKALSCAEFVFPGLTELWRDGRRLFR
jgi:beta-phosphoglucomutase-like phosphatase (HAD superfamily)